MRNLISDLRCFCFIWFHYLWRRLLAICLLFEKVKDVLVEKLIFGRGKLTRPFIHTGMGALVILGMALAPLIVSHPGFAHNPWEDTPPPSAVLSAAIGDEQTATIISEKPRAEVVDYTIQSGDTVSGIARKFGISIDTIRWANKLPSISSLKPGQILKILPVTGVVHKVSKGETIYSIAKDYSANSEAIIDFPFNTFTNDETFALAVGQSLVVPDGVMPQEQPWAPGAYIARKTPDAGVVSAAGRFVWPASGVISQSFRWYHQAIDIANKGGSAVLAADAGKVVIAGWPDNSGFGNQVMVDHGNGFRTRYAHLAKIYVTVGQTVNRGDQLGQMGSTGRSTGTHLDFRIYKNGATVDPQAYLK